jgi:hypothetical protein
MPSANVVRYERAALRIFVVWHPRYAEGEAAFTAIYDWLGGANRDLYRRGLGVPVQAWTSAEDEVPPAVIPTTDQLLTIVVPILDGEFVGRKLWRDWILNCETRLRKSGKAIVILPWAVHQAAPLMPGIGLLHLLGSGPCDTVQLCRRVTEACVVRVRDRVEAKPIRIFVSYARQDGSTIAQKVRQSLQSYGHLSVFLDEHDLQPGAQWKDGLSRELSQGAAMFAIVTDAYASRAWCREELRDFREPRKERETSLWYLRPVYILDSLSGSSTRSMFEVGNAPAARWNPERAAAVVDSLIREMLFAEVNRATAKMIGRRRGVQLINWVPDTWTLLQVLRFQPKRTTSCIAYPGDGLPRIELDRLTQVFPGLSLVSFEELKRGSDRLGRKPRHSRRRKQLRPTVLLSISDPSRDDLARRGMRPRHLDDAAIRVARALLFEDYDVMYGGRPREGFTAGFQDDSGAVVVEARLINYLGWPYTRDLTAEKVANEFGVTRYVKIAWEDKETVDDDPLTIADSATHTRRAVLRAALRDLDGRVVPRPTGLIALGGQLTGFAGFLPGVAEEIALALKAGIAVYVLGGFGGAASAAARIMSGKSTSGLSIDDFRSNPRYVRLLDAANGKGRAQELSQRVDWLRNTLRTGNVRNGLSREENTVLWNTANVGLAVALVSKGLTRMGLQRRR